MSSDSFGYSDFERHIQNIVNISNSIGDNWIHCNIKDIENSGYLIKKCKQVLSHEKIEILLTIEYHLVYNISYGVPVLCFLAWKQDGSLLNLDEYSRFNYQFSNKELFSALTQMEHPLLFRPFFTLHPCKTIEIMLPFLKTSKNPIISWLSIVGPYLHLKMDDAYFKDLAITQL